MLYQGGAELAFEMPNITRDMIVIIQGLVILFAGALEHMFRPAIRRCSPRSARARSDARRTARGRLDGFVDLDPAARRRPSALSVPLLLACLAGLYSERAGIFDIGLEGKMLAGAFAGGAAAAVTGSAWLGLVAAILVSVLLALVHGFASITHRGNQIVSGVAINFIAAGLDRSSSARPGSGRAAARRRCRRRRASSRSRCPAPTRCATCRSSARSIPS